MTRPYSAKRRLQNQVYYAENRDLIRSKQKAYWDKNKDRLNKVNSERKKAGIIKVDKERWNVAQRKRRATNREFYRKLEREYFRTNTDARLRKNLRERIRRAVLGIGRSARTESLIGCSISDLRIFLQSHFSPGMNWNNYGQTWVVDHHIPCAAFSLSDEDEQRRCFNWSNLRPLFTSDNMRKSDIDPRTGISARKSVPMDALAFKHYR